MGHINQIVTLITIQLRQTNSRFFDDPTISESELSTVLRCLFATTESVSLDSVKLMVFYLTFISLFSIIYLKGDKCQEALFGTS